MIFSLNMIRFVFPIAKIHVINECVEDEWDKIYNSKSTLRDNR